MRASIAFVLFSALAATAASQEKSPLAAAATPVDKIKVLKDFRVELLYSVPKEKEGSWVSLCNGPNGTLIACDQNGGLYRIKPPAVGQVSNLSKKVGDSGQVENLSYVKKIPVDIGQAQGLLWAFDSLYVVVNGNEYKRGLYRVTDSNGDGELDKVALLRELVGRAGEHGPHAVVAHPDGKSLVVLHGNQTPITELAGSRVPRIWGEDHLLPRMPDGRGFMAGVLGPGGAIYQVDPEGKNWELLCVGFRNQYDMAFNKFGDLFTYDADMEWDFNTPWYRPTRVCLVASGADYGWRNGTGKWPVHYADTLPSVVDIGPGSPTGVVFGYGAKFPAKYQDALYICDWSYGKMYAVHIEPEGAGYKATVEEFVAGAPLPLTDLVVHPDGALYFAIGGRNTQSGLYRVTYVGKESTAPAATPSRPLTHKLRSVYESYHDRRDEMALSTVWSALDSPDRYLRYAARVAIEHQDVATWREKALAETKPTAAINALLALVRVSAADPFHRKEGDPPADPALRQRIVQALGRIEWDALENWQRLELLRVYHVLFNRFGHPSEEERQLVLDKLNEKFPAGDRLINGDLCQLLVYLEAPKIATRTMKLLASAPTQEEQIEYAKALRVLKTGWTPELREQYFSWFLKAGTFKGGMSFEGFMNNIKKDAVALLTDAEKERLQPILEARPAESPLAVSKPRPLVKKWTLDELVPLVDKGLKNRDYDRGRQLFGAANCFACHRFNGEGGANGPDLTGIAGRFSTRDLLETIVDPSKVISDQYAAVVIQTADGETITGRIINLQGDTMHINTDMLAPGATVNVKRQDVVAIKQSAVSMMPTGLLDTLQEDEVLDLVAFLLSRGDRKNSMFTGP